MELRIPEMEALMNEVRGLRAEIDSLRRSITPPEESWDTERVAKHYGVSPKTIRKWVSEGKLPVRRIGKRMAFDPADLPKTAS